MGGNNYGITYTHTKTLPPQVSVSCSYVLMNKFNINNYVIFTGLLVWCVTTDTAEQNNTVFVRSQQDFQIVNRNWLYCFFLFTQTSSSFVILFTNQSIYDLFKFKQIYQLVYTMTSLFWIIWENNAFSGGNMKWSMSSILKRIKHTHSISQSTWPERQMSVYLGLSLSLPLSLFRVY